MTITYVPLSRLTLSPSNVRKFGGQSVDDLAASIEAKGLLQNLTAIEAAKGKYEVIAGGRRLRALQALAKAKKIARDHPVPCEIRTAGEAVELSLAENIIRQAMHPADQFDAFKALADEGRPPADIAARFGVAAKFVQQRLKLARVSPKLMKAYRAEDMTLEQLEAFTVSDDHQRQEDVWKAVKDSYGYPSTIRRMLTETKVCGTDRRAKLIGEEAYIAAGGTVTRDLFSEDDGVFFDDAALLERLVAGRLAAAVEAAKAEGWSWVELIEDYGHPSAYGLTRAGREDGEWSDAVKATAGAVVTFGREWHEEQRQWEPVIKVDRGLILPARNEADNEADTTSATLEPPGTAAERKKKPEVSARLLEDLTAHRTMALRAVMANDPDTALDTLVWTLAAREFHDGGMDEAAAKIHLDRHFPGERDLTGSKAAREMNDIRDRWADTIPGNPADLWEWVRRAHQSAKLDLLAYLVATSINAVQQYGKPPVPNSHQVHAALGLDMDNYWEPTANGFLNRIPKDKVIEALADVGESRYRLADFAKMKKPMLVAGAEKALAGKGWLPAALRVPEEAGSALAAEDRDERRQAAA